jgi:hypothetical protein
MGLERIGNIDPAIYSDMTCSQLDVERWNAFLQQDASAIYHIRQTAFNKWDAHEDDAAPWGRLITGCTEDITRLLKQEGFN